MHDIFFFTDIHGSRPLFDAIMNYCKEQDPEATIIFGGDACDRGLDGYKIMHELLSNPYIIYLKGNHEDLFVSAAKEIKEKNFNFQNADRTKIKTVLNSCCNFDYRYMNIQNSLGNGGLPTLTDWILDGMPMDFVEKIENLPLTFSTDTCDFCHTAGVYTTFKKVNDAEYYNKPVDQDDAELIMWTRSAFNYGWEKERTAIFGHTPVPYLDYYMEVPWGKALNITPYKWTSDWDPRYTGAKIDMDTGAVFTGAAYVLNVLTMKAQGFEDIDVSAEEKVHHDVKKIDCVQM